MKCHGPGGDACSEFYGQPLVCKDFESDGHCVEKCPDGKYADVNNKLCIGENEKWNTYL